MTIYRVAYANRWEAQRSMDFAPGIDTNTVIDRAIMSAAENTDGHMHRVFYPSDDTRWFDWPNQGGEGGGQYSQPWRLYLDENDLACMTALVAGGVTIPLTAVFPGPANNPQRGRPFYTRIELDRSQSYSFGNNAQTPQLSIAITATWGYGADADPAGALAASVSSSATTITVSDSSKCGPGDLLVLGYGGGTPSGSLPYAAGIAPFEGERVLVTDANPADTGLAQTGQGVTIADPADNALQWTGSGTLNAGEVIQLDQEQMLVQLVTPYTGGVTIATVQRAFNGTGLAEHSDAEIYAMRLLSVNRAQLGTTAGSYSSGAVVVRHRVPQLIRDLNIAEGANRLLQEGSGYAREVGSGEAARPAPGMALADLWDEARTRHGRKARIRGV